MDELKITSKFFTEVVSKILEKIISKKLGHDIDIKLNDVNITIIEGKTHAHVDLDVEIDKAEFIGILQGMGFLCNNRG